MKMSEYFNGQRSHWTLSQSRKYSTTQLTEQWWTNSSCTITQRHFFEWISHLQSQINYRYHWTGGIITSICASIVSGSLVKLDSSKKHSSKNTHVYKYVVYLYTRLLTHSYFYTSYLSIVIFLYVVLKPIVSKYTRLFISFPHKTH